MRGSSPRMTAVYEPSRRMHNTIRLSQEPFPYCAISTDQYPANLIFDPDGEWHYREGEDILLRC